MRRIDSPLTTEGKSSKNKNPRRGKSFGYQVLGFGSGGLPPLKYVEATGGTITTDGDYTIHTFDANGTFVVSAIGDACTPATYRDQVTWLVNAGGGAGGGRSGASGGGGGAGGFRDSPSASGGCYAASPLAANSAVTVSVATYPVTVGAGGAGGPTNTYANGAAGSTSTWSTYNTSGGGGGGYQGGGGTGTSGNPGGSGGGGGGATNPYGGGSGNSGGYSPPEGNSGGSSGPLNPWGRYSGGGGGATGSGTSVPAIACRGGAGAISLIDGTSVEYSAGYHGGPDHGPGGGGYNGHGAGGDGTVIIRYRSAGRP